MRHSGTDGDKSAPGGGEEQGVDFIDTADAYGPRTNEVLIHDALKSAYGRITVATKGGFERPGPGQWVVNGHPKHIKKAIEGSLERLKVEHIDLWQLHRIDPKVPVEETLAPVAEAVKAGKIKHVGLSEVDVAGIERAGKVLPIVSVQNLYNLGDRKWEQIVDYTAQRGMAFIPWYPLASGPDTLKGKIGAISQKLHATVAQVALALAAQALAQYFVDSRNQFAGAFWRRIPKAGRSGAFRTRIFGALAGVRNDE